MKKGDTELNRFLVKVSNQCNYMDPDMVKVVYNGLTRVVARELRATGKCKLPNLGVFSVSERKAGVVKNAFHGIEVPVEAQKNVRFAVDYKLKAYIRRLLKI